MQKLGGFSVHHQSLDIFSKLVRAQSNQMLERVVSRVVFHYLLLPVASDN